ncbi:MAG: cell wall hydrolase, partial [Brevundimonas sp.]
FFHTTAVSPSWRNAMVRVNQIGDHLFYRFGGRSGSRGAFTYAARPSGPAEGPRLIQASMDPTGTVREAGAVAYNLLVSQDSRSAPVETAPAVVAAPAPATAPEAPAAPAPAETTPTAA